MGQAFAIVTFSLLSPDSSSNQQDLVPSVGNLVLYGNWLLHLKECIRKEMMQWSEIAHGASVIVFWVALALG